MFSRCCMLIYFLFIYLLNFDLSISALFEWKVIELWAEVWDFFLFTSSYCQAQVAAKMAIEKLDGLGLSTARPDDYFAEMIKTDAHMHKVFHFHHFDLTQEHSPALFLMNSEWIMPHLVMYNVNKKIGLPFSVNVFWWLCIIYNQLLPEILLLLL